MLLSLVVIYLPNLFSCQKSQSEPYCYVVAIAPLGGLSIPAQGSISVRQRLNLKQTSLDKPIREGNGGAERDRTVDPLLAKQVLSQLSYSPLLFSQQRISV
jgi:hypothetical protein